MRCFIDCRQNAFLHFYNLPNLTNKHLFFISLFPKIKWLHKKENISDQISKLELKAVQWPSHFDNMLDCCNKKYILCGS